MLVHVAFDSLSILSFVFFFLFSRCVTNFVVTRSISNFEDKWNTRERCVVVEQVSVVLKASSKLEAHFGRYRVEGEWVP